MIRKAAKLFVLIAVLALVAALAGCAATYTGIRYKDLQVQNKMSASIFLDPVPPEQRTVFIQVRNTSDKPFDLQQDVAAMVAAKGYQIVQDPNRAHYWLQANVLQVGEMDASALETAGMAGFGGPLAGAAAGALNHRRAERAGDVRREKTLQRQKPRRVDRAAVEAHHQRQAEGSGHGHHPNLSSTPR